ncbi:MAG: hypothetical protein O3A53_13620 [Acidobacteria bacterium]|nr:hypothetical protein [Acidobacteriota bacterium]MDA1235824.1 hypothetical protein [Acidobacteriota bacterium]
MSVSSSLITGSRRGDILLLLAFAAIIVGVAPWLPVYYSITAFELTLTRIETDGVRTQVPLPPELDFDSYWNRTPDDLLPRIEKSFRSSVARETVAHYELTVDYSFNSAALDQQITWQAP